jgi:hypothetical protein
VEIKVGRLSKLLRSKEVSGRPKDLEFLRIYRAALGDRFQHLESFDDEDASAQHAGWSAAALDALSVPEPVSLAALAAGAALLLARTRRRRAR